MTTLIDAAPDLLDALKLIEGRLMRYGCTLGEQANDDTLMPLFEAIEAARAAIAKAEGAVETGAALPTVAIIQRTCTAHGEFLVKVRCPQCEHDDRATQRRA